MIFPEKSILCCNFTSLRFIFNFFVSSLLYQRYLIPPSSLPPLFSFLLLEIKLRQTLGNSLVYRMNLTLPLLNRIFLLLFFLSIFYFALLVKAIMFFSAFRFFWTLNPHQQDLFWWSVVNELSKCFFNN